MVVRVFKIRVTSASRASTEATAKAASIFWMDYLAVNRTCPVDTIPRVFGLMPARFASRLDYLRGGHWTRQLLRNLLPHRD